MADAAEASQQRLMVTVAWLYHTRGLRQSAIAERLNISQPKVSRLLDQAGRSGIVRTTVVLPQDDQSAVERELENAYGLLEAHVFDVGRISQDGQFVQELGQLLALQLSATPIDAAVIGFTSWSRTLQEAVGHLEPLRESQARFVVEMLGDLGPPQLQHQAAQVTSRLAELTGAQPKFLRIPGVSASVAVKETLLAHDVHARDALGMLDQLDFALAGIGTAEVVAPLRGGDNFFTAEQFALARSRGAVAELNLRFIDEAGRPVQVEELTDLVVGATLEQLATARRRLGVGGGPAKYRAIRAALRGQWINTLVTDATTAQYLLAHQDD